MALTGSAMDHPNRVAITAPSSDSSNRIASTAFVQSVIQGLSVNVQNFFTPGTVTYTPSAGLVFAQVECVGAAGGGGGTSGVLFGGAGGGGGGSGGYLRAFVSAALIKTGVSLTIGSGGTGVTNNNGNAGTATTFGSSTGSINLSAGGGSGGGYNNVSSAFGFGGLGGSSFVSGVAGTLNVVGNNGGQGYTQLGTSSAAFSTTLVPVSGFGANSFYGAGAQPSIIGNANATNGNNSGGVGAGGGGGVVCNSATTTAGGSGAQGLIVVTEFLAP